MTQSTLKWVALFVGCFLLQSTVVPSIAIMGVKPDLLVLALFAFAMKFGVLPATYVGFFLGLGQDLYTPGILGQSALAKTMAGFFAGLFNERVVRIDPILQAVLLLVVFLLNDTIFMAVQVFRAGGSMSILFSEMFTATLPRAFYSLIFAALPLIWENFIQPAAKR